MVLNITVDGIQQGGEIPRKYTCDGENISPRISISGVPVGSKSLALIVEDPDAPVGLFVHWVIYNIPPDMTEIKEGMGRERKSAAGAEQGKNDFGRIGYDGPCPPRGHGFHRYYFRLYALSSMLSLSGTATRADLLKGMEGKVAEMAEVMGRYRR
ncbi:MAG: YbhB/YbcL family Raf kinase inhibitor-like protein [Thermoplasmata archaeon]